MYHCGRGDLKGLKKQSDVKGLKFKNGQIYLYDVNEWIFLSYINIVLCNHYLALLPGGTNSLLQNSNFKEPLIYYAKFKQTDQRDYK